MEAAHITWRPLGELFVERGLITRDELEEALVEQAETRKRLGTILVSRGLVSGPELTSVLVDQLGMELTKESGFGSGLWDEIRRRHPRGGERSQRGAETESAPVLEEPVAVDPQPAQRARKLPAPRAVHPQAPPPTVQAQAEPVDIESALAKEREALTAAFAEERAELQMESMQERAAIEVGAKQERAALEAALADERAARQQALEELVQARADASARAVELADLSRQVAELRGEVEQSTAVVVAEQQALQRLREIEAGRVELEAALAEARARNSASEEALAAAQTRAAEADLLEARLGALEDALASAQARQREAVEELDHARAEAGVEAKELRSSIERVRSELDRLDAATSWFEYWSGTASPPAPAPRKA